MLKNICLLVLLFNISHSLNSQSNVDSLLQLGNKFYKKKDFNMAGKLWMQVGEIVQNKISKQTYYFYATHSFAEGKDSINTFQCLDKAILENDFNDLPMLQDEDAFGFLNKSKRWKKLIAKIRPTYTTNPDEVKIIDSDVKLFWKAYDKVQKDTANAEVIYKKNYLEKGSIALQDYYVNKMAENSYSFTYVHGLKDKFY